MVIDPELDYNLAPISLEIVGPNLTLIKVQNGPAIYFSGRVAIGFVAQGHLFLNAASYGWWSVQHRAIIVAHSGVAEFTTLMREQFFERLNSSQVF